MLAVMGVKNLITRKYMKRVLSFHCSLPLKGKGYPPTPQPLHPMQDGKRVKGKPKPLSPTYQGDGILGFRLSGLK